MLKFKFKFDSIQNVKKNLKKKAEKELASIESSIKKFKNNQDKLKLELKLHKLNTKNKVELSEVQFLKEYVLSLYRKISLIQLKIDDLNKLKMSKILELKQKNIEFKMLNILEEQHLEEYYRYQNTLDLKNNNEIAILKYERDKK